MIGQARVAVVRPYWKVTNYYELVLDTDAVGDPAQAVSSLTAHLGTGWTLQSGTEAIWNPGPGAKLVHPSVRWAHVEVIE